MWICSYLLNKFLRKSSFFVYWFVQLNKQKTTLKKKISYFLKNCVASLFIFLEKVFAICKFFTAWCFETFCILFIWSSIHSIGIFFAGRKCVDLVVIFNNVFHLCLHKIFNIVSTTKVNYREFYFFILDLKRT